MVLVVVLWTLLLLAFLAASFATTTRTEARIARNAVQAAKAEALADAGVYLALAQVLSEGTTSQLLVPGTVRVLPVGGAGAVRIAVENENGKVSLNGASPELLEALFTILGASAGTAQTLADRIVDFRDSDDLRRPNGAEAAEYQSAKLSGGPKNRPFELVEELLRIPGMTGDVYSRVVPYVTAAAGRRVPDRRFASQPVADAMLLAERLAGPRRTGRRGNLAGNGAGGAIPGSLEPDIEANGDAVEEEEFLTDIVVSVVAEGRTPAGAIFVREAIVQFTGDPTQPFIFADWRRGSWRAADAAAPRPSAR